ncbi:MAG: hypothetical protein M3154_05165 [Candidatus Eremiobacteraeota bacterium]|nr:hypothetical protein [Candidatus Eremiobacteraeota bacterium]
MSRLIARRVPGALRVRSILASAGLLLASVVAPSRVVAQSSSSASVTANVQQPITVSKTNDLALVPCSPG